jgi:hypothetical protein
MRRWRRRSERWDLREREGAGMERNGIEYGNAPLLYWIGEFLMVHVPR